MMLVGWLQPQSAARDSAAVPVHGTQGCSDYYGEVGPETLFTQDAFTPLDHLGPK